MRPKIRLFDPFGYELDLNLVSRLDPALPINLRVGLEYGEIDLGSYKAGEIAKKMSMIRRIVEKAVNEIEVSSREDAMLFGYLTFGVFSATGKPLDIKSRLELELRRSLSRVLR